MTTQPQRAPRAVAREATGLLLLSLGALGVLAALGAIHWAVGLTTAMAGLIVAGISLRPSPKLWQRRLATAAALVGYVGLTTCVFVAYTPLGWLAVSLAVAGTGLMLASEGA
ncbi:hypothetical protein [Streptomyces sp. NPDC000880]